MQTSIAYTEYFDNSYLYTRYFAQLALLKELRDLSGIRYSTLREYFSLYPCYKNKSIRESSSYFLKFILVPENTAV
jgi:hypothetical protein